MMNFLKRLGGPDAALSVRVAERQEVQVRMSAIPRAAMSEMFLASRLPSGERQVKFSP